MTRDQPSELSARADEPKRPIRSRRGWLFRLFTLFVGLMVMGGLAEGALWVFAPIRFHEWMVWVPDGRIRARAKPNQVFYTESGDEVRINSLGFRGPERTWQPAPGTLRLLAFGESSTFCYHAHGEQNTWPSRLEAHLRAALGRPVEVINLALPGYDCTNSKVNYLFLGRELHPHVALFYHTWNDMKYFRPLEHDPMVFTSWVPNKPWWQEIARATQLGRYARNAFWAITNRRLETRFQELEKGNAIENQPVTKAALAWSRTNYEDCVRFTREDGVLPVLISQASTIHPSNFSKSEYRQQMGLESVGMTAPIAYQTWQTMNGILASVAGKDGAVFVDGYSAVPHDFKHLTDHVHLTDEGSDVLAREVARVLMADPRFLSVAARICGTTPAPAAHGG